MLTFSLLLGFQTFLSHVNYKHGKRAAPFQNLATPVEPQSRQPICWMYRTWEVDSTAIRDSVRRYSLIKNSTKLPTVLSSNSVVYSGTSPEILGARMFRHGQPPERVLESLKAVRVTIFPAGREQSRCHLFA